MTRLPPDRREVTPSREISGRRRGVSFGRSYNVSVPISFGLPLLLVGAATLVAAIRTGAIGLWVVGGVAFAAGLALFASGKRL